MVCGAVLFCGARPGRRIAYRLLQLSCRDFTPELTRRCLFLADWVPARLLAAAFCLTGHFMSSRDSLVAALGNPFAAANDLLYEVGFAALGDGPLNGAGEGREEGQHAATQNRELAGLLSRSAVGWILMLSLLVLVD